MHQKGWNVQDHTQIKIQAGLAPVRSALLRAVLMYSALPCGAFRERRRVSHRLLAFAWVP